MKRLVLFSLITSVLLTSCARYHRAPPPTAEPPSDARRKATQKPYTVAGKRYEPISNHAGFEEEGIASSYGRDFNGRPTSSGEPFDMYAMTAAHKTLPMGVYVRVQHKRNANEVIVRINDRGPFVRDRIIDLSEGAAGRLGMLNEGVAQVRITALGYRTGNQEGSYGYRPANYDNGTFSLQVGSFTVRANAYRYADELKQKFGFADVQEAVVKGTRYYRVRLGRYSSLRDAQAGQEQYERKGFSGSLVVAVD